MKRLSIILLLLASTASAQLHNTQGRVGSGKHTQYGHVTVPLLAITPTPPFAIPSGKEGDPYVGYTFQATGGVTPYTWIISSVPGTFPLTLSTAGVVSGTPTQAGTYDFTVKVTDAASSVAFGNIQIVINPAQVSGIVLPVKPQNWADNHEGDPPGGIYDETVYLGVTTNGCPTAPGSTCDYVGASGLQASMNDWAVQTTDKWRHVIVTHGTEYAGTGLVGGQQSGVLVFKSKVIGSRITNRYIVYESDTPNTADQTACSHGIQDNLTESLDIGLRNNQCDGTCLGGFRTGTAGACVGGTTDTSYNDIAKMWTITATAALGSAVDSGVSVGGFGSNHIVLRDVELRHSPGVQLTGSASGTVSIDMGGSDNTIAALPSHIGFDRYYLHEDVPDTGPTNSTNTTPNGFKFNCNFCWLSYGYADQILRPGGEGHVVSITTSTGPMKLVGNWWEGESMALFIGGAVPQIPGIVSATDLEVRRNRLSYPKSWRGLTGNSLGGMVQKNRLETKECHRCIFNGNILEESDATGGQKGNLLTTTVRSCSGGDCENYQADISDVMITNNILRHGCQGSQGDGRSGVAGSGNSVSEGGQRWLYDNNLYYDIQRTLTGCFESQMNAGTDQGMKFNSGGSIWTNCTAGKAPNGRDAFVDCTASPDNTLGQHQANVRVGDLVQVTGCTNSTFNTGASLAVMGTPAISPTVPTSLIVYYRPLVQPTTQTTTVCRLGQHEGFPRNVTVTHNTIIINFNGTELGSPIDSNGTATDPIYSQNFLFKNNIGIGGGFGHQSAEGTPTETTQWDSSALEIHHNVWPTRTASKYSDILTLGSALVSPPALSYFPTTNNCTAGPTGTCLGMVGNSSAGSFDHNLANWHDYRLCQVSDVDSRCAGAASVFAQGGTKSADDNRSMGFDPTKTDIAQTETKYSGCAGDCGVTGPFQDTATTSVTPDLNLSTNAINFGNIISGQQSSTQTVTLSNVGGAPLIISSITKTGTNAAEFTLINPCNVTIQPTGTCDISLRFGPTTIANGKTATITVNSNDPSSPAQTISLTGNGVSGTATFTLLPASQPFGTVSIGSSKTLTSVLTNTGGVNLTVSTISVGGTNSDNFSVATTPNPCTVIAPAGSCNINITFTPLSPAGAKTGTVTVSSNGTGSNVVSLTGTAQTGGGAVTIYPKTTTIKQTGWIPLSCDVVGGGTCTYTKLSGTGTCCAGNIYKAPSSNTDAVIQATNGSNTDTTTIHVSGTFDTIGGACPAYPNTGTTPNDCTMTHTESTGTMLRNYRVIVPTNFVPGTSGLVVSVGSTGHPFTTGCCVAGSESGGWQNYLLSLPTAPPIFVFLDGASRFDPATSNPHVIGWRVRGGFNYSWCHGPTPCSAGDGTVPDENDFFRQVVMTVIRDKNVDPHKVLVVNEDNIVPAVEVGITNSDIVAVVSEWAGVFLWHTDPATLTVGSGVQFAGQTWPDPVNPISFIILESLLNFSASSHIGQWFGMCGTDPNTFASGSTDYHPATADDKMAYFSRVSNINTFQCATSTGSFSSCTATTKFCNGYQTGGIGIRTTLEAKIGTGGKLGTGAAIWVMVGSKTTQTPYCSFDWAGNNTYCNSSTKPSGAVPLDLRNTTCNFSLPCNHAVDHTALPNSTTGYDIKGLVWKFAAGPAGDGVGGHWKP